eukprot:gene11631-4872_t
MVKISPSKDRFEYPFPPLLKKHYDHEEQHALKYINSTLLTEIALDLTDKNITKLPEEIKLLINLQQLTLSSNKIRILPKCIGALSNLEYLILSENFLTEIPPEIGELQNLDLLLLNNNLIESIPPEIGNLTKLGCLFLQGNKLKSIPKEIANLKELTSLNLKHNQLTEIPIEISKMKKLHELQLTGNPMAEIPSEFTNIKKLDRKSNFQIKMDLNDNLNDNNVLNLQQQALEQISLNFEKADSIKSLNLSKNELRKIPKDIGDFSSLIELNLSNNKIRNLPTEIGKLYELTSLDISNNKLSHLPKTLFDDLSNLESLRLNGNPFGIPLPKIASRYLDDDSKINLEEAQRRIKRRQICEEILISEKEYLKNLTILSSVFATPIQRSNLISNDKSNKLFATIDVIVGVNRQLYKDIEGSLMEHLNDDEANLGKIFMTHGHPLKLYTPFVSEYDKCSDILRREILFNSKLKEFLKKQKFLFDSKNLGKISIFHYYIMPVQRLPRYELLLMELQKNTSVDHQDYSYLSKALDIIGDLAKFCDSKKAEADRLEKVSIVAEEFNDINLVQPSRILLHECENVIKKSDDKKVKVFIFNDIFFIGDDQKVFFKFEYEFMSLTKLDRTSFQIRSVNFDEIFIFEEEDMEELYMYWHEIIEKHWGDFIRKTPKNLQVDDDVSENSRQSWGKSNKIHSLSSLKGIDYDLIGKNEVPQSVVNQDYLSKMKRETRVSVETKDIFDTSSVKSPSITPPKSPSTPPIAIVVEQKRENRDFKKRNSKQKLHARTICTGLHRKTDGMPTEEQDIDEIFLLILFEIFKNERKTR